MRGRSPRRRFRGTTQRPARPPSPFLPQRFSPVLRSRSKRRGLSLTSRPPTIPKSDFSLFVGNISFDTTSKDLWGIFNRYRRLLDVYIPTRPSTRKPWGYGFVRFAYEQDAANAIAILNERRVDGKIINVSWAKHKNREVGSLNQGPCPAKGSTDQVSPPFVVESDGGQRSYLAVAASD
ncbi:uncharacterized protein LOC131224319 [Magnolia sinica]|uniref:uncharacterized protein LOC131224319 n=1 Tax=Magnolia sinica TaxID=86752 RepID=UPI002659CB76|nr:uncharacterized protein LOC131224319 [Magnolia sinica]